MIDASVGPPPGVIERHDVWGCLRVPDRECSVRGLIAMVAASVWPRMRATDLHDQPPSLQCFP